MRSLISASLILTSAFIASSYYATRNIGGENILPHTDVKNENNVNLSILQCVPSVTDSKIGMSLSKSILLQIYIKMTDLRQGGLDAREISKQLQKWFIDTHPEMMTGLSDKEFMQMGSLIKKLGDADVQHCIRSISAKSEVLRSGSDKWKLRS